MSENSTSAGAEPNQPVFEAGDFSSWLRRFRRALAEQGEMDVDCGECVGCCSSSYFIHVKPQDTAARCVIPEELLFEAPGLPEGHRLMGYDEAGRCPMLEQGRCSIYSSRPQTCRSYDCRLFTAAGIAAGGEEKNVVNQRVARWAFSYPTACDRNEHRAVRAAASFIREHADCFPGGRVPTEPSQLAVLAVKVYELFLETPAENDARRTAERIVAMSRAFDSGCAVRHGPGGA